ncbi:MAG: response regulator [Campylobacterota bacterium]|nr:response regulator [Campylobacterota bacterium]
MKILAVDDSSVIRDQVSETLYKAGYNEFDTAVDGVDALEQIDQQEEPYDFFIIDINMPRMDGFTLISNIRNKFDYMDTPIMVLSTERSADMKKKGKSVGATSWIVKPFDQDKFIAGIEKTLNYVDAGKELFD